MKKCVSKEKSGELRKQHNYNFYIFSFLHDQLNPSMPKKSTDPFKIWSSFQLWHFFQGGTKLPALTKISPIDGMLKPVWRNILLILFDLYAIEWYQMKGQIMKFSSTYCIPIYHWSIYCATPIASSVETPTSGAFYRPRPWGCRWRERTCSLCSGSWWWASIIKWIQL